MATTALKLDFFIKISFREEGSENTGKSPYSLSIDFFLFAALRLGELGGDKPKRGLSEEQPKYPASFTLTTNNIGYIELSTFDEKCSDEFKNEFNKICLKKIKIQFGLNTIMIQ